MINEYVEKALRRVVGAQWFPDKEFPTSPDFHPEIIKVKPFHYLKYSTGDLERLEPGCFITHDGPILEYQVWPEEDFKEQFVVPA